MSYRAPILVVSALLLLAACSRDNIVPGAHPAATGSADLSDHVSSDKYRVTIHYPALTTPQAPLAQVLRAFGDRAKQDFLASFADPEGLPDTASFPWRLSIDMRVVARSDDFVSVVAKGASYTGGAHGNPILASFTYDVAQRRVIALDDLFADPQAGLDVLSGVARKSLLPRLDKKGAAGLESDEDWILRGTAPIADNYQVFTIWAGKRHGSGLTLWFTPYQIAAYANGIQTVDVPAAAFAGALSPAYRRLFGVQPGP